ncbi:MAG TPA: 4-(cytidine 5'-diphospho)-2-C-methyl-D-erythritol kinase [Clostridia bacterium]|nr:MAG: 4-diphosphocytidyl-2-C-methyl-D-erythritol kinase [Firmicutes bacterium ADurb.Bin146]HOD92785.1 4-(cytidine 5'-diphospho)-2-C-methyl-D-erythritol kinase [Clostridia bacterium]HQM39555.1 4-(cytidine 5'-diphospho)-2-C-methyl-D-erythritol kinase [Clostridia bacterium]
MIVQKAYAKINIGLDIKGLREDRYHEIDTIMQTVELGDRITFTEKEKGIYFWCDDYSIKQNENTAYLAAKLFMEEMNIKQGIKIDLYKTIPVCSGLGGGSSDAAAVLRGLNFIFKTNLSYSDLEKMSLKIGADVPFCIRGGTQRVNGKGEILKPLKDFSDVWFVVVKPKDSVETAWAYKEYDKLSDPLRPDMDLIQNLLEKRDILGLKGKVINIFEKAVIPHNPSIGVAIEDLLATDAITSFMTGSGSAVVAVYSEMRQASMAYVSLSKKYDDIYITKTSGGLG